MPVASPAPTPHLILGGARSGKSAYAETLVTSLVGPYVYVATAQTLDDEMKERVRKHRERRQLSWETIETQVQLLAALQSLRGRKRPVLVDCLTLWLSNLIFFEPPLDPEQAVRDLCTFLPSVDFPLFLVSNEVGGGIVPENALARKFRDLAGFANQKVAAACRAVTLVVAGIPLSLK